ncbi:unnamed protein product [Nyctereutes procyonoides]|uniref:acireductone dioxygenase (Fe(2+)-requiring) n=1 Tax=Nyctereutes procyonoides TaxID=34880 RepID=A0A811YJ21_NYCPR|nr:unnamed protein product [Nyctereutes procyonoides]
MVQAWYRDESANDSVQPGHLVCLEQLSGLESWKDIITICKDKLPNHTVKIKIICTWMEIHHVLASGGYFDMRDKEDRWVLIFMQQGDTITLPNCTMATWLFVGEPKCTVYNLPADQSSAPRA